MGTGFVLGQHRNFTDAVIEPESCREECRLTALETANEEIFRHKRRFRLERHEYENALMTAPMSPGEAYGYFGFLLGLLAPAAIFARTVNYGIGAPMSRVFVFCLLMNLTCAFVGKWTGKSFAKSFARANRKSWTKMLFQTTLLGFCWAMITGAAGGAIFFGVGAIFGAIMAIPVGVAAFPLFATIYRLLERGEEVEFKHFLPIALGVSTVISAYILGC